VVFKHLSSPLAQHFCLQGDEEREREER
jgi:hypothetical protein